MKRLIIELTDEQHSEMMEHIQNGAKLNFENETFSGYSTNLNCLDFGFSSLEVKMYGDIDLGDVNWKIE
jgi:hypothetical protein